MNREEIYQALFNIVSAIPGIVTSGRKLRHWDDIPAEDQPALFQLQTNQSVNKKVNTPYVYELNAEIYVYCNSGNDPDAIPATQLNNILDAIDNALQPDFTGYNTLGGLAFNCVIDGRIDTDEGVLGNQTIAIIPIKITVVNR